MGSLPSVFLGKAFILERLESIDEEIKAIMSKKRRYKKLEKWIMGVLLAIFLVMSIHMHNFFYREAIDLKVKAILIMSFLLFAAIIYQLGKLFRWCFVKIYEMDQTAYDNLRAEKERIMGKM